MNIMKSSIKAVSFDLWETLIHDAGSSAWEEWRLSVLEPMLTDYGATREKMKVAYARYTKEFNRRRATDRRDIDVPEQISMFLGELGIKPTPALLAKLDEPYVSPVLHFPPRLNESAARVLDSLKSRGCKIALISNTGKTPGRVLAKLFENYGIAGYFDALVFSNEVGYMKPREEIFRDMLGKLGAEPHEAVHVGDELYADIHGAKSMGMKAVWVKSFRSHLGLPKNDGAALEIKPDAEAENLGDVLEIVEKL